MASITSLVAQLSTDYPQFRFEAGETFRWLPDAATITYARNDNEAADLLHELAHALREHRDFSRDITLLEMERDAWQLAQTELAARYDLVIGDDVVDDALNTYRDWLHARSLCPNCQATGLQSGRERYRCLACLTTWRVNDARHCALRRYIAPKNPA